MSGARQTEDAVLDYLQRQNRPYSAVDVFSNLHKAHGKTAVTKALEQLTDAVKIKEKVYGKQKVYFADQSKCEDVSEEQLAELDTEVKELNVTLNDLQRENKRMDEELKDFRSTMSEQELLGSVEQLKQQCKEMEAKLNKLKSSNNCVSPKEKEMIATAFDKYMTHWKKRKRLAKEMSDAILEGWPKSKKEFFEAVGIETDEEIGVSIPGGK